MFDVDKWQEIFSTIKKNKLRTILTAFSVAWGIFILIILLAAGQGLRNGAQEQFGNDATNSIWIEGGQTSMAYAGYKPGREIQLTNADHSLIINKVQGIDHSSAVYKPWESKVLTYGNEHVAYRVRSCLPDHKDLEHVKIVKGRFINQLDIQEYRKVCVLGMPVAKALFKDDDPINKLIDVGGISYRVVGQFNDDGKGDNDRIYVPLFTMQRTDGGSNHLHTIWTTTGSLTISQSEQVAKNIRSLLAKKYHFSEEDKNAVGVYNNNVQYAKIMGLLDGIKIFIYIIGVLTLIAGIVGVSNIMMIVVKERNKEIGVRKALGATPASIVSLIIQESVFITFIAGYIGLMAGIGLVELIRSLGMNGDFFKDPEIDLGIALSAVLLIIISGAIAGLIPALNAARVEPITALRED
jgi:putative ABC transport system permease protein